MESLCSWKWGRKVIPEAERRKRENVAKVKEIISLPGSADWKKNCNNKTVLITGDGSCLPEDIKEFELWNIPHDLYCCNRSILYYEKPVNHWGAVDAEESMWLSQYCRKEWGNFMRHVIGSCIIGYDCFWAVPDETLTEFGRRLWIANSGYFGMLCCIAMGYEKIILAGMPLDRTKHWYDPEGAEGPNWVGDVYTIWMDFKTMVPDAQKVRSMSGYSGFIMGKATKEWVQPS